MSVTTTLNVIKANGNGATTIFPYTFKILKNTDLVVEVGGVVQTLTTDYTVSGVGDATGGNVTFVTAPPTGTNNVVISRVMTLTQEIDLTEASKFPIDSVEEMFDRNTMQIQQIDEENKRSLRPARDHTASSWDGELPDPGLGANQGKLLRIKADGNGVDLVTLTTQQIISTSVVNTFRGLHVRTNPDRDVADKQVSLIHADEIVMDDGARVPDWDDLDADITVAGAGGLDTGAEAASTWYEIHAIRKSSDSTKNLLLHQAKDYFLDESETSSAALRNLRLLTATATDKLAQGFKVDTTGKLEFVDVLLDRENTPAGNIFLTIEGDSAGDPDGTPLATSVKLDTEKIATSNQLLRFVFHNPATLTAATQYHLVLQATYAKSDTVVIRWAGNTANSYPNGVAKEFNGTSWSVVSSPVDFNFKVYITRNDTAVTMPSGFDQRAKIGYVRNGSGSDFAKFIAIDRKVRSLETLDNGIFTSTLPLLVSVDTFVPPVPLRLWLLGAHVTIASSIFVAGVPDGYLIETGNPFGGLSHLVSSIGATTLPSGVLGPIHTDYQAIYLSGDSGNKRSWLQAWEW